MTLCGNGSMDKYIELVKGIPQGSRVVEVGSYLGGSIATLAIATLHMNHQFYSVESFTGNRDNTVDGFPLPGLQKYLHNLKTVWPFLNINTVQLPSRLAAQRFSPGSIQFLFIDGGHTARDVIEDIRIWRSRVARGGIIAGDDYNWDGVRTAVQTEFPTHREAQGIWWTQNN
jgi:predicted O-methyltransferase YrrM